MRSIILALVLVGAAFTVLTPSASAVGWCSETIHADCDELVCVGTHSSNGRRWCDTSVSDPCDLIESLCNIRPT